MGPRAVTAPAVASVTTAAASASASRATSAPAASPRPPSAKVQEGKQSASMMGVHPHAQATRRRPFYGGLTSSCVRNAHCRPSGPRIGPSCVCVVTTDHHHRLSFLSREENGGKGLAAGHLYCLFPRHFFS